MDMLLLGGLWTTADAWDATVAALAERGHRGIPVELPGQDDGDRSATLADQERAVLAAIDARQAPVLLVGHSGAAGLAWIAADRRPDHVAGVVLVGGMPPEDGATYFGHLPVADGVLAFPGWEAFAGADSDDLDETMRASLGLESTPMPAGVVQGVVSLGDDRRYTVPVTLVCPEFSADDAKAWLAAGEMPELERTSTVRFIDIPTGHWPQASAPEVLADALAEAAGS